MAVPGIIPTPRRIHWWQTGVIYQIYIRSFQDGNHDGIGDLCGIIQRLDYLKDLGINAIWITPFFRSPMKDFGYDISDYREIEPLFGNMADFDRLRDEIHRRNMKLILDLVPNHTSDQHPWFQASRSSRMSPLRNWYIWKDADEKGDPPNNWLAMFGGSAWEWDEHTGQYYYHAFLKEQPDLNWRNPEVKKAMFDVMRFWLDKDVDGFRVDVMWHMIKDAQFRDNPINPDYTENMSTYEKLLPVFSTDQPEVHDIVREMRALLEEYDDRLMIGEIYLPIHKLVTYYGNENNGAHLPFNFMLLNTAWDALKISAIIDEYEGALPKFGWPNWVLGNHDQPRITSRVGASQARVAALMLFTLRGTPTVYYGEEIGMRDAAIPSGETQDPQGFQMPDKNLSRDPARTPMQWDHSTHAGFSQNKPWLPVNKSYQRTNVSRQTQDPFSMLNLYRKILKLRQSEPSLQVGDYKPVHADEQVLAFIRTMENKDAFLVILNLSHRPAYFKSRQEKMKGKVVLATVPELEQLPFDHEIALSGDEGIVIRLENNVHVS